MKAGSLMNNRFAGPYRSVPGSLEYIGNKMYPPCAQVQKLSFEQPPRNAVLSRALREDAEALHAVDNAIFFSAVNYFKSIKAQWCNLPLTTLMISSPGEIYAGKHLDYTTDTLPVDIKWFDLPRAVYLSESSQFYLELRLLLQNIDKVFCIYNSFRKERADFSHLSEFQHIEFEGRGDFKENMAIAQSLLQEIVRGVLRDAPDALACFLTDTDIENLGRSVEKEAFETITFKEALTILYRHTEDPRYKEFSLKHFGAWEEVTLSNVIGKNVWITHYPLMQIPFYHAESRLSEEGIPLAENADLILQGYREVIGSGARIRSHEALMEKAKTFNLPPDDYAPYLQTRALEQYKPTAGFGLGWQRLVHWMLRLPAIWEATHIPRGHLAPIP